jgi:hypothetical protein
MLPTDLKPPATPTGKVAFQQTCGSCGCIFRVEVTWQRSFSYKVTEEQRYACPECQRGCRIKTASIPEVTLISQRTDGLT